MSHLAGRVRTLERLYGGAARVVPLLPIVRVEVCTRAEAEASRRFAGASVLLPAALPPRIEFSEFMALASLPEAETCFLPTEEWNATHD
jgi:hypothetical protein